MRPKIFVSSVIEGFNEYRQSAKQGIIECGGDPILVEDCPGLPISPRNICLDGVASSDIYVVIIGHRGGWIAPSGKLVVEEEFEEARKCKLPIIAFIEDVTRDHEAELLVRKITDYVNGLFRSTFTSPDELKLKIVKSLEPIIENFRIPKMDSSLVEEKIRNPQEIYSESVLRVVFAPERDDVLIDPVSIDSEEFMQELYSIGHLSDVKLFSYKAAKDEEIGVNEIIIMQSKERGRNQIFETVRLEISTHGLICIDMNVTGERPNNEDYGLSSGMTITEEDIMNGLRKSFGFAYKFYSSKDPYLRFDRSFFNCSLSGIEYKALIPKPIKQNSMQIPWRQDKIVTAFDKPRLLSRQDLLNSKKEINTALTMFRRKLKK